MAASDSPPDPRGLPVAVVVGAHGLRGALRVRYYDSTSDALRPGTAVTVVSPGESSQPARYTVRRCDHRSDAQARLVLAEIGDRTAAEALRGATLVVAREDLPALAEDEFYVADLLGLRVRWSDGRPDDLGVVRSFVRNGPQDLVEVECERGGRLVTWLLPVSAGCIRDVTETEVLVDLPEGMGPDDEVSS